MASFFISGGETVHVLSTRLSDVDSPPQAKQTCEAIKVAKNSG